MLTRHQRPVFTARRIHLRGVMVDVSGFSAANTSAKPILDIHLVEARPGFRLARYQ